LDAALKHYMVDLSARMLEIKTALQRDTVAAAAAGDGPDGPSPAGAAAAAGGRGDDQAAGADLAEREALLDELMDIVSSIDYARGALGSVGGSLRPQVVARLF
jgi:hsp70-interacting protein